MSNADEGDGVELARSSNDSYRGCVIAFGTMHRKEKQVAPAFMSLLGAHIMVPPGLDTDQFGTFSGEVLRTLTPRDAARAKARLAISATGHPYALASEASYGPLPGIGWPGHEEILIFLDDTRGIEVLEGHRSLSIPGFGRRVTCYDDMAEDRARHAVPGQAMVVRPATGGTVSDVVKGITDPDKLAAAITAAAAISGDAHALVEPDLRAHHNPTRRDVLTLLGSSLAVRLATRCPACGCPGYGRTGVERGLRCADCGVPTDVPQADLYSCPACSHHHAQHRTATTAEPRWCPNCNP